MKQKALLLFVVLLISQLADAKEYKLVVRGKGQSSKGHTEVTVHGGADGDSITVTPGATATSITVTLHDALGNVVSHDLLSTLGDELTLQTPPTSGGCLMVIRDDNDVVFTEQVE